ncbi:MAG: SDR family oxidoreductase [Gammaproteobacteria bacterium]|nr:SDR family oxidoreductase [Gammaproteobacteria bacterium]
MALLQGKRVVITGSSRGLGRATAVAMAKAGARVVVNGTDPQALAASVALVREAGGEVASVLGSVADASVCAALIQTCVTHYGGIDVLVNNAGQVRDRTLFKMSEEDFDAVIAVHLRGAWACGKYAAIAMRERGGGQIINIISSAGLAGGFGQSNYAAAKAGMLGLQRTWVLELTRYGIRCNAFWPIAATQMTQVVFENAGRQAAASGTPPLSPAALGFGSPSEVAQGLLWLASDAANHFNGQCITFNGRKTALWSVPREVHETFRDTPFSAAELCAHYAQVVPEDLYQPRFTE